MTIDFVAREQGTELMLTQTGFSSLAARNAHEKGWNRCIDGIEQLVRAHE